MPVARIESLTFGRGTPYETRLDYQPPRAERVLSAEVADIVRRSLVEVVEKGTAPLEGRAEGARRHRRASGRQDRAPEITASMCIAAAA